MDVFYRDYGTTEFVARSDVITRVPSAFESAEQTVRLCQLDGVVPVG